VQNAAESHSISRVVVLMSEIKNSELLFKIENLQKGHRLQLEQAGVPRHRLTLISGRTGCGKSTLVSILAMLQKADAGNGGMIKLMLEDGFEIDYHDVYRSRSKMEQVRRRYFGFVFQHDELIDSLTCFENIIFPVLVRKPWNKNTLESLREAVRGWLEDFEFSDLYNTLDRSPATLSGGQRQRLSLVRGVIHDPPVLFADEPIASVDEKSARGIVKALKMYIKQLRKTVILVIHDKDLDFFDDLSPYHIRLSNTPVL
jgi:putative ABC transport system ATP-binding protein